MKALARLLFLAGAVAIGLFLFRAAPREVTLVYALSRPGTRSIEVEIDRGRAPIRRAEIRLDSPSPTQVTHRVRLSDGDYLLHFTLKGDGAPRYAERPITITESGTVVVPVAE
jgi:hypothetical protein